MKSRIDLDGLVSVIVPFYGAAQQLVRAVESVAAQDAVVAEVIVVDDASPSGRDAIAMLQTRRWPFCLRCVRHERNLGPGGARNTAWSAADPRSVFLAFLDADDTWDRQKVAVQASWMLTHPAFAWSAHRCGSRPDSWTLPNVRFHELRVAELLRANPIATPTVMVRRGVEARFRDGWRFCEDLMLWLDLLKSGQRGALLHVPLATLGRPPTTRGGLTGMLEEMHRGELRIIETLRSDRTLSPASAVAWRSWMRIKYAVRRLTCQ